jgi:hypothetical protein
MKNLSSPTSQSNALRQLKSPRRNLIKNWLSVRSKLNTTKRTGSRSSLNSRPIWDRPRSLNSYQLKETPTLLTTKCLPSIRETLKGSNIHTSIRPPNSKKRETNSASTRKKKNVTFWSSAGNFLHSQDWSFVNYWFLVILKHRYFPKAKSERKFGKSKVEWKQKVKYNKDHGAWWL